MASAYLNRTVSSASNRRTFTFSAFIKRSKLGLFQSIIGANSGNDTSFFFSFDNDDTLAFGQGASTYIKTNRIFRDVNGWYHIVLAVDTTNATANNRTRLYINGVEETSFGTRNNPSVNTDLAWNSTVDNSVGADKPNTGARNYFDGYISHAVHVDGTQLTPTSFGEFDSNGVWKPKTSPSVTYGTNGFFLKMDNSGNMGLDSSGNSNNFTTSGTITQAKDTPSNVFATWNALYGFFTYTSTYANGNTTVTTGSSQIEGNPATLGASSGKYYWEVKYSAKSGGTDQPFIGISSTQATSNSHELGNFPDDYAWYTDNGTGYLSNNNTYSNVGLTAYTVGDVISVALDLDNNKLYFAKNGTWEKSADPTSGSTGTGAISITATSSTPLGFYFPSVADGTTSYNATFDANFGNGYFGTTAVTSAGANASGNGIFEYDVPTGYTALSTKGLDS